jgi:ADP-ribosylglycohydrolase
MDFRERLTGVLLGTAVGDALGLVCEGMSAKRIARRFGRLDRFHLLGRTGYVSDDTEQSALVAQSLARHPADPALCVRAFRRSLLGWFWRLPWGIGMATIRSSFKIMLGLTRSGVRSAGNGSAMRAAVVGVFFHDNAERRREFGAAIAQTTHTDERAVQGALYVAELAAAGPEAARKIVTEPILGAALDQAIELARRSAPTSEASETLKTTGYVVHTVPFALYCYLCYGDTPLLALQECISAGGDTDSIAAILGAWLGARHGEPGLPAHLIAELNDGPFGPAHLRALAAALAAGSPPPRYSWVRALFRNLALYPVVIFHGFRRIFP